MKFIKIELMPGASLPTKGTEGSAGWDLYAPRDGLVYPGETHPVHLGIRAEVPKGHAFIISHRSGHHRKFQVSAYGLIDSDYRGEFVASLTNHSTYVFEFREGDRVAQMRLVEVPDAKLLEVKHVNDTDTERGGGGHGSTGD